MSNLKLLSSGRDQHKKRFHARVTSPCRRGVGFATAIHPEADESIPGRETTPWSCWSGQGVVHVGVSRALVAPNCHATIARSPILPAGCRATVTRSKPRQFILYRKHIRSDGRRLVSIRQLPACRSHGGQVGVWNYYDNQTPVAIRGWLRCWRVRNNL